MEYDLVFSAVESYQQIKKTITIIAIVALLPTIYVAFQHWRKPPPKANKYEAESSWLNTHENKIISGSIIFMYTTIFTMLFGHANSSIQTSKERMKDGQDRFVTGQFIEIPTKFGKNGKAFTVNNIQFEYYPNGTVNPGQFDNDCKKSQCTLKDGDEVRITYFTNAYNENTILEITKTNS